MNLLRFLPVLLVIAAATVTSSKKTDESQTDAAVTEVVRGSPSTGAPDASKSESQTDNSSSTESPSTTVSTTPLGSVIIRSQTFAESQTDAAVATQAVRGSPSTDAPEVAMTESQTGNSSSTDPPSTTVSTAQLGSEISRSQAFVESQTEAAASPSTETPDTTESQSGNSSSTESPATTVSPAAFNGTGKAILRSFSRLQNSGNAPDIGDDEPPKEIGTNITEGVPDYARISGRKAGKGSPENEEPVTEAHPNDIIVECCTPEIKTYNASSKTRNYCAAQGVMEEEGQLHIEGSSSIRKLQKKTHLPYCQKSADGYEVVCEGAKCDCAYQDAVAFAKACEIPFFRCLDADSIVYLNASDNTTTKFGCQFNLEYDGSSAKWKQSGKVALLKDRTDDFVATKESPVPVHCAAANGGAQLTCTAVDCAKTLLEYTKTMKKIDEMCGNVIATPNTNTTSGSGKSKQKMDVNAAMSAPIWMVAFMTSAAIAKGLRF